MAVSGASGWIPSCLVKVTQHGDVETVGLTHNVPRDQVTGFVAGADGEGYTVDIDAIVEALRTTKLVRVPVRHETIRRVRERVAHDYAVSEDHSRQAGRAQPA